MYFVFAYIIDECLTLFKGSKQDRKYKRCVCVRRDGCCFHCLASSLQMAELEKRLAQLEMAVGSGSDKQVHRVTPTLHTLSPKRFVYLSYLPRIYIPISFSPSTDFFYSTVAVLLSETVIKHFTVSM